MRADDDRLQTLIDELLVRLASGNPLSAGDRVALGELRRMIARALEAEN
jgi:hypothetical protein